MYLVGIIGVGKKRPKKIELIFQFLFFFSSRKNDYCRRTRFSIRKNREKITEKGLFGFLFTPLAVLLWCFVFLPPALLLFFLFSVEPPLLVTLEPPEL